MRIIVAIAVLCLFQIAFAADPKQGVTVLQPSTAGNASKGVTVLTPSGDSPTGACVTGTKGCAKQPSATDPNAPIAPPPPGMAIAIVIRPKGDCGCDKDEVDCKCEKFKYVEPELKQPLTNCSCTDIETCACLRELRKRSAKKETVAPEQSPNHVVPEVRAKLFKIRNCADGPCAPEPEFVQPEIKKECACANVANVDCACAGLNLKPNF